jgi:pimeloyl-ACP methyl ester carboxylesterase
MDGRAREWFDAGGYFEWKPDPPMRQTSSLQIFHAEFGDPDAPFLLLVHGFPTSSIDWFDVAPMLSRERRVCVVDFPGFGFSDKPQNESYTVARDASLLSHYVTDVLGVDRGVVVAHDRGDSVALNFASRCASGQSSFEITDLVLSNANIFLPMSSLTDFQRMVLNAESSAYVAERVTADALAQGMGESTFTPPRPADDPSVVALSATFAHNDGMAVIHDTIQYLVERSEHEEVWLDALAATEVPTTVIWGLHDTVSPPRVAAYVWNRWLSTKPGDNSLWFLPGANHYLQHDDPEGFVEIVTAALGRALPDAPGALADPAAAPILVDRSRPGLRSAKDVLAGP